jgi:hypothetical protein
MTDITDIWRRRKIAWRGGRTSDEIMNKTTSEYLHTTGDWPSVRDWLFETGLTKQQIICWFSEEDFGDFALAVEEGWGWPMHLQEA